MASLVSLTEWFVNFYDEAAARDPPPVECVCRAGELVFVPRGWWHIVINVEPDTIAVTQNYVARSNLLPVLRFLSAKPDQISGVAGGAEARRTLSARLEAAFEAAHPGELAAMRKARPPPRHGCSSAAPWAAATAGAKTGGGAFSFGF